MEGTISSLNKAADSMAPEAIPLKATEDKFGGVIIDSQYLPEASVFKASLKHSLFQWRIQGKRGVWLKIPRDLSTLVPLAIQEGFTYHHAEPSHVMLVTWLADEPSTIPANASHQVGVGAFVLNADGEVLAVQEKCGVFEGAGIWKMPTGTINQGEDIFDGAIREVKEETGSNATMRDILFRHNSFQLLHATETTMPTPHVSKASMGNFVKMAIDTEFVEVVGFRQAHKVAFDKSDLFFLCVLRPLSCDITMQDTELTAAKWMPLAEFSHQEYLKQRKLLKKMLDVCIAATTEAPACMGLKVEDIQAGTGRRPQNFYYNV